MLLLRQKTESLLKDEHLEGLFIQRADNTNGLPGSIGTVLICGPCGQPLMQIPGVTVPLKMSELERDYAFELITKFFNEKGDDVDELWSIKQNKISIGSFKCPYIIEYTNNYIKEIGLKDEAVNVSFVRVLETDKNNVPPHVELRTTGCSPAQMRIALDNVTSYEIYIRDFKFLIDKRDQQDDRIAELTTCKI